MLKSENIAYNNSGSVIKMQTFHVIIHPCADTKGFWAECPQLQGCNTSGGTLREVGARMFEAVDLCLDDCAESTEDYILDFEVRDA